MPAQSYMYIGINPSIVKSSFVCWFIVVVIAR